MRGLPRLPYSRAVVTETNLLIAVVDDEEPVRTALMRLMRSAGLTVETFGSGAEFLNSLETRPPDCVVLDLHMPHMDGFNVQTQLARKCATLPVIIVTGHDLPEARERAMAGGISQAFGRGIAAATGVAAAPRATGARSGAGPRRADRPQGGARYRGGRGRLGRVAQV